VTLASAGGTDTLVASGTGPALTTKGLVAGDGMLFTSDASSITLASLTPRVEVIQITNNNTGVTCNGLAGRIRMQSAIGSLASHSFTVSNSWVLSNSLVLLTMRCGANFVVVNSQTITTGSFQVNVYNMGLGNASNPAVDFLVLYGGQTV
jgi:hypothetical protein